MKIILFGATGMIGQGALLECLDDPGVEQVLAVVRRSTGRTDSKLVELVHKDFADYSAVADKLRGYDACLFCLGVSAAGLDEAAYTQITLDYTLAAARTLLQHSPKIVFCYVSGAGTVQTFHHLAVKTATHHEQKDAVISTARVELDGPAGGHGLTKSGDIGTDPQVAGQ